MSCVKTCGESLAVEKAVKIEAELDDDDDDEEQAPDGEETGAGDAKKKKRKRNKKKKAAVADVNSLANVNTAVDAGKEAASTAVTIPTAGEVVMPAMEIRGLASQGSSQFALPKEQTYPPRKPVHEIFMNGKYPLGMLDLAVLIIIR